MVTWSNMTIADFTIEWQAFLEGSIWAQDMYFFTTAYIEVTAFTPQIIYNAGRASGSVRLHKPNDT